MIAVYSAGRTDPAFALVEELLQSQIARDQGPYGAAVAAYVGGRCVLDTWAGWSRRDRPWGESTKVVVWSATKGIAAAAVQVLHDRGAIDIDAPVAACWPEFAANGKEEIRIRDVLAHTAGLPWWKGYQQVARLEGAHGWDKPRRICASLGAAAPTVAPKTNCAYHNLSFGWLLDEILVRTTGCDAGEVVAQELCTPLGLAFTLGGKTQPSTDLAVVSAPREQLQAAEAAALRQRFSPSREQGRCMLVTQRNGIDEAATAANLDRFRNAPQPACNAQSDARSIAKLYGVLANQGLAGGKRFVSATSINEFSAVAWSGTDAITDEYIGRALGYQVNLEQTEVFAPDSSAFGHPGWGGSVGFALPAAKLGFGYVTNRIDLVDGRARGNALSAALLAAL